MKSMRYVSLDDGKIVPETTIAFGQRSRKELGAGIVTPLGPSLCLRQSLTPHTTVNDLSGCFKWKK